MTAPEGRTQSAGALTERQFDTLEAIEDGELLHVKNAGFFPGAFIRRDFRKVHLNTANALVDRGLVDRVGREFSTGDQYCINAAGRAALAAHRTKPAAAQEIES